MYIHIENKKAKWRPNDYIILQNIKDNYKHIHITLNQSDPTIVYDIYFSDIDTSSNIINYTQFFDILQELLYQLYGTNHVMKMNFLKCALHNVELVLLSGGPTTYDLDKTQLEYLKHNFIIISIKYVINFLEKHEILPDIQIFSFYTNGGSKNILLHMKNKLQFISFGIYLHKVQPKIDTNKMNRILHIKKLKNSHSSTFRMINNGNIDVLQFQVNEDTIIPSFGHVVLEIVIPLLLHCNIKTLYTFGWDLYNRKVIPSDNNVGSNVYNLKYHIKEDICLKQLDIELKKKGISVFRCNNTSKIPFEYKDIFSHKIY